MKKICILLMIMLSISACSEFLGDKTADFFTVEPGLVMSDSLYVQYRDNIVSVFPADWGTKVSCITNPNPLYTEPNPRFLEYRYLFCPDSAGFWEWQESHYELFKKLKDQEVRKDLGYYYLGVKSIKITSNYSFGDYKEGTDISSLFELKGFGPDHKRVFTYPNCDLAFQYPDYILKSIDEFCSVSPLFMPVELHPLFEIDDDLKLLVKFTVTIIVEDEFLGERRTQGTSIYIQ